MFNLLYLRAFADSAHTYYLHDTVRLLPERDELKCVSTIAYDFVKNRHTQFDFSDYEFDIFVFDCGDGMGDGLNYPSLEETLGKLVKLAETNPTKRFFVFYHMAYLFDVNRFKRDNLFF